MLIKKRKFGKDMKRVVSSGATHVIKIGFNSGQKGEIRPGKFNGFVIYKDTLGLDNQFLIDYPAMQRLGISAEQIQKAKTAGFQAEANLLPQELHFIIMNDAKISEIGFEYPGTFEESYECYGKEGLTCSGNGDSANRKQEDGTQKLIACNPFGKIETDPLQFCELSGPGKPCKAHYRLIVCLLHRDPATNLMKPLVPELGMQAKYRLDSSSEYGALGILEELDRAAERLGGRLNGITGTLSFQKKGRRTGDVKYSKSIVGHVFFQLHEESIRAKEQMLAGNHMISNCIPPINALPSPPNNKQITFQKPEPEIIQTETLGKNMKQKIAEIKQSIELLTDEEALEKLHEKLSYLAEISGKDPQDWMKEFTITKDGKFINEPQGFFVMQGLDQARHIKAMQSLKDTLTKCMIAINLTEEREVEQCVK